MPIVVERVEDGSVYILLGTGFGMYKSVKPHFFFGNLVGDESSGQMAMVAVCDLNGRIGWFQSEQLRVLRVDGQTPEELLVATPD